MGNSAVLEKGSELDTKDDIKLTSVFPGGIPSRSGHGLGSPSSTSAALVNKSEVPQDRQAVSQTDKPAKDDRAPAAAISSLKSRLSRTGPEVGSPCDENNNHRPSGLSGTVTSGRQLSIHLPVRASLLQVQQLKEEAIKRSKLEQFRLVCSEIFPHVYVSGEDVANDKEALKRHDITHVINFAGLTNENTFPDEFEYLKFNLYDSREEDVAWFVYEVIDFIEAARQSHNGEGKALLHCVQGVSRSVAFAIAYVMWYTRADYNTAFTKVKQCRAIASPNSGFICNLLEFQNYLSCEAASYPFLFRIASHGQHDSLKLVPKPCRVSNSRTLLEAHHLHLDSRGCFVLQGPATEGGHPRLFVWRGKAANEQSVAVAMSFVDRVQRLEGWGKKVTVVRDGETADPEFAALVDKAIEVVVPPASSEGGEGAAAPPSQGMASMVVPARFTDLAGLHLHPTAAQQEEYTEPIPNSSRSRNEVMMSHTLAGHELRASASVAPLALPLKVQKRDSASTLSTAAPEPGGVEGHRIKPTLYKAERLDCGEDEILAWSWDKIGVYDADDLAAEDMYFLQVANGISYLWLGEGFEPLRVKEGEEEQKASVGAGAKTARGPDRSAKETLSWAKRPEFTTALAAKFEVEPGSVLVELGGAESEAFWAAFENGY